MLKPLSRKTIYILITLAATLIVFSAVYLTKMQVVSQGLNINKGMMVDRLCNYTIYNDFYYHIIDNSKAEEGGSKDLAKLIPVQTTLCYNNRDKKLVLQPKVGDKVILEDAEGADLSDLRAMLEEFSATYALIAATQDQDYFQNSYKRYEQTMKDIYLDEGKLVPPVKDVKKHYYTSLSGLPIDNMEISYFNLEKINSLPSSQAHKGQGWQPNLVEWTFNEQDRIYLQYLKQWNRNTLDDYVKSASSGWQTYVKLPKYNNNQVSKMFIRFVREKNKVETLFMDSNGYVYILIMKTQNPQGIKDYFDDYLRIAYGIDFINDGSRLDASFQMAQQKVEAAYNSIKNITDSVWYDFSSIPEECRSYPFLLNSKQDFPNLDKVKNRPFDKRFAALKEMFGEYPNDAVESQLAQKADAFSAQVAMVKRAIEKLDQSSFWELNNGCENLLKQCPAEQDNALACVQGVLSEDKQ